MPARPFVTGMLAAAMAATALRLASGPSTPPQTLDASSYKGTQTHERQGAEKPKVGWYEQMDKDPEGAGRASAEEALTGTLCEVIALPGKPCPVPQGQAGLARPMYTDQDTGTPEVVFAILPDPIHTHLALWFDRSVDALEDALADSGWEYQKHWMPWSLEGGGGGKMKEGEQQRLFLEGQSEYPGVILFRPKTAEHVAKEAAAGEMVAGTHPLVVFLIGDSPTSGINQGQFQRALEQFHTIAPGQDRLRIVGPNFTGSGPSLHALLGEAKKGTLENVTVDVASGSISDWRCSDLLPHGVVTGEQCTDAASVKAPDSFVSFDVDFAWEVQQTEIYLHEKGKLQYSEIAQLSEDESGFGALGSVGTQADEILKLTFPRNISHLRSAYQKNKVWGFGSSGDGANSISLNLDFDETHQSDDAVPGFANKQMPVSQEATLGQVTSILEERHIKAVLLSATDVLDELFVAQILARQAPNLVVVVRGTDVLFLRSGDGGVYHNMYAVGPWPLIPKNYFWSQGEQKLGMRDFPNDHAQGFYTATRYLMQGGRDLKQVQDYSSPLVATERPPLWFMSIGHGAYWPLALLSDDAKTNEPPKAQVQRSAMSLPKLPDLMAPSGLSRGDNQPPVTQLLLILGACLLSLTHMGKCLNWKGLAGIGARYRISEPSTRPAKLRVQLGISGLGLLGLCLLCGPAQFPHTLEDWSWAFPLLLSAVALSLATASCGVELLLGEEKAAENPLRVLWVKVLVAVPFLLGTAGVWAIVWGLLPAGGTVSEGLKTFFVYRSRYPLSGASPVLPLLLTLAAMIVYLLNHLDRFTFGKTLRPRLPDGVTGIPNCPDERTVSRLSSLLNYPPEPSAILRKLGILFILTFNAFIAVVTIHLAPRMFDGGVLATVCGLAMFTVLMALLWDLSMAAYLWRQLKLLCLDPLESSSLRTGFSSVCGIAWKDLWLMPQAHRGLALYRTLSRALEQAGRTVMRAEAALAGGVGKPLGEMWALRDDATKPQVAGAARPDEAETLRLVVTKFGEVQDGIEVTARKVLEELKESWADEVGLISEVDEPGEKGKHNGGGEGSGLSVAGLRKAWRDDIQEAFPGVAFKAREDEKKDEGPPARVMQAIREEWIALIYIHYIRMVLIQIRSRLLTSVVLYLLLVISVTSYPYLNRHVLILALAVVFSILAATAVTTYASINRDPILSRTTESQPGRLDIDFYVRAASMVGVPLLGLVASQFPEVSSFLFSWIEPGMAAVK